VLQLVAHISIIRDYYNNNSHCLNLGSFYS